jgi:hypothetical protein
MVARGEALAHGGRERLVVGHQTLGQLVVERGVDVAQE